MSVRIEQNKLSVIVRDVLTTDEQTRNNNERLIVAVCLKFCGEKGINLHQKGFIDVMINRKAMDLPSFESITRCRRKLQEADRSLRANDNVQAMRELREEEYREWAVKN